MLVKLETNLRQRKIHLMLGKIPTTLRSDGQGLLYIPKTNCKTLGDRAFAHAAPQLWNSLPLDVRNCENISVFKKRLKTFLFNKAYNPL
jgi:hypothetical protein